MDQGRERSAASADPHGDAPPPSPRREPVTASMPSRLGARFLDYVVLVIPLALLGNLLLPAFVRLVVDAGRLTVASLLPLALLILLVVGLALAYEVVLTPRGGTLGKRWVGLRVVRQDTGGTPGSGAVAGRWLLLWAAGLVPVLGTIAMALSPYLDGCGQRRGWHDRAAGTRVVIAAAAAVGGGRGVVLDDGATVRVPPPRATALGHEARRGVSSAGGGGGAVARHVGGQLGVLAPLAAAASVFFLVAGLVLIWSARPTTGDPRVIVAGVPAGEAVSLSRRVGDDIAVYVAPEEAAAGAACSYELGRRPLDDALDPAPVPERRTVEGVEYGLVVQTEYAFSDTVVCAADGGVEQLMVTRWSGWQDDLGKGVALLVASPLAVGMAAAARAGRRHLRGPRDRPG